MLEINLLKIFPAWKIFSLESALSASFKLIAYLVDSYALNVKWLITGNGDMKSHLYETSPDTKENQELRVMMQDAKTDPDLLANIMIRYSELKKIKMIDEASKIPTPQRPTKRKT